MFSEFRSVFLRFFFFLSSSSGVRSAAPMLLRVYALGSVLLVTAGLLLSLPGIVGHAQLHLAGIVMALGIVRLASNQRFLINAI